MSLEEVVARVRDSGDVDLIVYETGKHLQICVGDPLRPRAQRLERFPSDRKSDAAAWLHRTILARYPDSRYAERYGSRPSPGPRRDASLSVTANQAGQVSNRLIIFPGAAVRTRRPGRSA